MTTEFEDLFGRLSDHESKLAETLGDVSGIPPDSATDLSVSAAQRAARDRPVASTPSNSASSSLRLEQALSRLAEGGDAGSRTGAEGSRFFSPEELAKAIQRGANVDVQKNERDRLVRESNDLLKSIDEKIGRLAEAGKERFF